MIKNSSIVNDTRKVRKAISNRFDNDIDKYIDYLLFTESEEFKANHDKKMDEPVVERIQKGSAAVPIS